MMVFVYNENESSCRVHQVSNLQEILIMFLFICSQRLCDWKYWYIIMDGI